MARVIELPKLSPTMEEGTLVRWAVEEGTAVNVDDLLAEVETDKATMEFRSFDKGVLLKKLIAENTVAKLGQPVAIFGEKGEDISALLAKHGQGGGDAKAEAPAPEKPEQASKGAAPASKGADDDLKRAAPASKRADDDLKRADPAPTQDADAAKQDAGDEKKPAEPVKAAPEAEKKPEEPAKAPAEAAQPAASGVAGMVLAPSSPRVRRIARERDIDLDEVKGSGSHGRVTEEDLARKTPVATRYELGPGDVARAPSSMRKTIARRITEAKQTVPHFYLEVDLAVEALSALREQINAGAAPEDKVSFNDMLVRACALALRAVPESNASWIDGQIVQHNRADISIAVAIEDGLVTPVVRDADVKSVRAIARAARELIGRAKTRKLKPEEMANGVFSVSNLGMLGVDRFSAVINPPESMILAVGAVRDVPVVKDGAVVPGKRLAVTLSCDHRVVDGALGARFLQSLRALVENPIRILA